MPLRAGSLLTGAFESPLQLPGSLIQLIIEAGESRVVGSCPASDFGKRRKVDAVEASKAVPRLWPTVSPLRWLGTARRTFTQAIPSLKAVEDDIRTV